MDIKVIRQILAKTSVMELNRALAYLGSELYDPEEIDWEDFDELLVMYRKDRASLNAELVASVYLILPKSREKEDGLFD